MNFHPDLGSVSWTIMRILIAPVMLAISCASHAPALDGAPQGNTGTGVSGMAPTQDDLPVAQPWSGMHYLRPAVPDSSGKAINDLRTPIIDSILTDAEGNGWKVLPAGTYLLLDHDRAFDHRYKQLLKDHAGPTLHQSAIDKACLDRWLTSPLGVIRIVAGDTLHIPMTTFGKCAWDATPCVHYSGPYPP